MVLKSLHTGWGYQPDRGSTGLGALAWVGVLAWVGGTGLNKDTGLAGGGYCLGEGSGLGGGVYCRVERGCQSADRCTQMLMAGYCDHP